MQSKIRADDTIAAIATAPGPGAIGVVRLSGPEAISIGDSIFHGSQLLSGLPGYRITYGEVVDSSNNPLDQVLVSVFRSPHSYTGEDVVEISCHGGMSSTNRILTAVINAGARIADPGEFTRRAFLNRKMDLSQAEAVADLIASRSERARETSLLQVKGSLGGHLKTLKNGLVELCTLLEIDLDFSEEGVSVISTGLISQKLSDCRDQITRLLDSYESGRMIRDGIRVALFGPPNVGKSSLFNALLAQDRAIVSEVPGTTRDYIEEELSISGILFSIVDTAGTREISDQVESAGVLKSAEVRGGSDLLLAVVDASGRDGVEFWKQEYARLDPSRTITALNKADLLCNGAGRPEWIPARVGINEKLCSARTGEGVADLKQAIVEMTAGSVQYGEAGLRITNRRHFLALQRVLGSLSEATSSLETGATNEFVALDLRGAILALGEIVGEVTSDEILDAVFGRFCIGK